MPLLSERSEYIAFVTLCRTEPPTAVSAVPLPVMLFSTYACGGGASCSDKTVLKLLPSVSMRTRRGDLHVELVDRVEPAGLTPQATTLSS